ncbi:MAG: 30S ribosome-binding factor RbfA [Candidatus Omnitrophica bacterium]|nr:30S ribosome-binding factor RbfA [Candidatus Omnitrophota bacterium]
MQARRADRVAALIKHELAEVLARGMRDPRIGFVTITEVKVSDDLKYARVFYSVLGDQEKKEETQKGLDQARGYFQRDLANILKLRFTPHLSFELDSSLEEGLKIDGIIRKIHQEE